MLASHAGIGRQNVAENGQCANTVKTSSLNAYTPMVSVTRPRSESHHPVLTIVWLIVNKQRQIGSLASKNAIYERLLGDINSRVSEEDRTLIRKALVKVSIFLNHYQIMHLTSHRSNRRTTMRRNQP